MTEILPGWTSELERSFKEVLFRFLEEVHSTKAALYLCGPDDDFLLATQYGFGRREMIPTRHDRKAALVVRAVKGRGTPIAINNQEEATEIDELMKLAGTARMMVVPIFGGERLVGFVDVRDKGQERPFNEEDLSVAVTIAEDLLQLVERTKLVADVRPQKQPAVHRSRGAVPRTVGRGGGATLDELGLEQLHRFLGDRMRQQTALVAAAITVATPDNVGVRVLLAPGGRDDDRSPLLHHQAEALRSIGWDPQPPDLWSIRSEMAPCRLEEQGSRVIGTKVVLEQDGWALVVSVVGLASSGAVQQLITRLSQKAEEVSTDSQRRFSRRRLSFKLLHREGSPLRDLTSHSVAVSRLAWATAQEVGVGLDRAEEAAVAGLLHDVGMTELDYDTLYRHPSPGPEERRIYKTHTVVGEKILRDNGLGGLAAAVRHHHERWDGNGYPDRLAGESIPVLARLIHVAEVFDVLTSGESYRRPVSRERALVTISSEAGRQFDPAVVEALVDVVRRSETNDGEDFATYHPHH